MDDLAPLTSHQRPQNGSAAVSFYKTEASTRRKLLQDGTFYNAPGVIPVDHTNSGLELKVQRKAKLVAHGNRGAEASGPRVWAYRGVVPVEAV